MQKVRKLIVVETALLLVSTPISSAKAAVNDSVDDFDPDSKCPHNEIMYNVKLRAGLKAGTFTDIGKVKSIKTCIRLEQ